MWNPVPKIPISGEPPELAEAQPMRPSIASWGLLFVFLVFPPQNTDTQIQRIQGNNCPHIFPDPSPLSLVLTPTLERAMYELQPGDTVIEFSDSDDTAVIRTRSRATVNRWKRNPSVRLIQDIDGDDPAILLIRADLVRLRADTRPAPQTTGKGHKTSSKSGNTDGNAYKNKFYRSAFDPDK